MSEKKYFVKLRPEVVYFSSYGGFESTVYTIFWLDKLGIFVTTINRDEITKSELAEIMDGAFYKGHEINQDCVFLGCEEWINPLIELVPVEEVEK